MRESLFDDSHGYYRKKNPIGKKADFITAPEISSIFGELVAAYLLHVFSGKKKRLALVEMGAGHGTWFCDILSTIKNLAQKNNSLAVDFLTLTTFHIIEIGEELKKIQQKKLQNFSVNWHENFTEFLTKVAADEEIFFISNELFDCFAIDQFVKMDIGWCERMVIASNDSLQTPQQMWNDKGMAYGHKVICHAVAGRHPFNDQKQEFRSAEFNLEIHQFVEKTLGFEESQLAPIGAVFEYSAEARKFMTELCEVLQNKGGMAIIIDYGYDKYEFANTLQAIKNHHKVTVLNHDFDVDITALVDFCALQKIVDNFSLNHSLITQQKFLTELGIQQRQELLRQNTTLAEQEKIDAAINRLINPNEMGNLFKTLIVWK